MLQQQVPPPIAPPTPAVPIVMPDVGQTEDGLLRQFISLNASTFSRTAEEDSTEFLREMMDKRFRLMLYEEPRIVEIMEFILRGVA